MVPPGDLNLVDCFYQRFLNFSDSDMMVGFKLSEQVFDDPGVYPVSGGGNPYGKSVKDDIHERRIDRRRRHDDNVGG